MSQELYYTAKTTKDKLLQKQLSKHLNTTVRKALAMNKNLSEEVANLLARDAAINVSFWAAQNPKSTIPRGFSKQDTLHKCVLCIDVVNGIDCKGCKK